MPIIEKPLKTKLRQRVCLGLSKEWLGARLASDYMKRIYKNKSKLRLIIDTKCDLTGYVDACICCRKPDNSFVAFPATVKDIEKGILFYDVQTAEDIDQSGWWKLWPEVVFDDDRNCAGRAVKLFVYEAGSV